VVRKHVEYEAVVNLDSQLGEDLSRFGDDVAGQLV
jgi:hypothetical protein